MSVLVGNLVKVRATFKDENNQKQDPATVKVHVKDPDATITTYTYGTDVQVVRESKGIYYIEIDTTDRLGEWQFIWQSSGTYQATGETSFTVANALFEIP